MILSTPGPDAARATHRRVSSPEASGVSLSVQENESAKGRFGFQHVQNRN